MGRKARDIRTKTYAPQVLALSHDLPGARTHDTPGPINTLKFSTPYHKVKVDGSKPEGVERNEGGNIDLRTNPLSSNTVVSR